MMKRIATLSLIFTAVVAESAGVRNYTAVTNVSFHNLTYIPSNFLDHAFGESENDYEQNVPTLPTIQRIDFHSATGLNTHAQLDYGILGFGICTNLRYAAFDSLKSGVVNLDDVTAPLVVSCSNIAKSAVVNVSDCTNLREIRFDTVPAIVNYDSRWIPQNTDWKAYVPSALFDTWKSSQGWLNYQTNLIAVGHYVYTDWVFSSPSAELNEKMAQPGAVKLFYEKDASMWVVQWNISEYYVYPDPFIMAGEDVLEASFEVAQYPEYGEAAFTVTATRERHIE